MIDHTVLRSFPLAAVPRPAGFPKVPRALVFLRDSLTTDSTGRILPGHERGDQALADLAAPTTHRPVDGTAGEWPLILPCLGRRPA